MELNFSQDSEPFFKYLTTILTSKGLILGHANIFFRLRPREIPGYSLFEKYNLFKIGQILNSDKISIVFYAYTYI